ncbi:MAG: hypothetical protein ABSA83_04075 [Verrucomicrobiota bacterium]
MQRTNAGTYTVTVTNASTNMTVAIQLHVLVPQLLSSSLLLTNGRVFISFGDYNGGSLSAQDIPTFVLQASSNLLNWVTLPDAIVPTGNGQLGFIDNLQTVPPPVFFRVLEQ